jgi:hypothetical protein
MRSLPIVLRAIRLRLTWLDKAGHNEDISCRVKWTGTSCAACLVAAAILMSPPLASGQAVAGRTGQWGGRQVGAAPRAVARCLLQGPSRWPERGRDTVTAEAPKGWECDQVRGLWERAEHVDGDGGRTFRFLGHRWQCVTVARPDHGRHTTLGCFHVHWKVHYDAEHMPGRPIVRFFVPVPAD